MFKKTIAPLLAATALVFTAPAHAGGSEDRARTAIAAAEAKIETAESLGVATSMPREAADAKAALAQAQEHFKADRNDESIEAAIKAESIADASIGQLQQKNQQAAVESNAQVNAAASQAVVAQQNAADANARAAAAERSAAASAAQAEAAREVAADAQTTTTVTRKTKPTTTGQVTTTTTVKEPGR
jgi:hypothetical protein